MNEVLVAALIALSAICASTIAPWIMGRQQNRNAEEMEKRAVAREKRADARQDKVAQQAARAAKLLKDDSEELAARTDEVARVAEEANRITTAKLGEIKQVADLTHTLVNSNMDEEKKKTLDGLIREHAFQVELIDLRTTLGQKPTDVAISARASTEQAIEDLTHELEQRALKLSSVQEATDAVDASAKVDNQELPS